MDDDVIKITPPTGVTGWVTLISQTYGPYAFGVASLLIIWYTVVAPQLDKAAINFDRHQTIMDNLSEIVSSQRELANTLQRTAIVLEQAAIRLASEQ